MDPLRLSIIQKLVFDVYLLFIFSYLYYFAIYIVKKHVG